MDCSYCPVLKRYKEVGGNDWAKCCPNHSAAKSYYFSMLFDFSELHLLGYIDLVCGSGLVLEICKYLRDMTSEKVLYIGP